VKLSGLRILVTGAAGFIGSHLAERLAPANEVVALDDFSVGSRENLAEAAALPNLRIVEADVRSRERMLELCAGVDVVFHLAISCLRTSLRDPERSHDVNAGGTLSVCRAAHARGVRRLVYVSSSEVYGSAETAPMSEEHPLRPTTVYGASKLAGELYALAFHRTYALPVCVVRPFNTYGPREPWQGARAEVIPRFLLQLEAGRAPVVYGDGGQTRDFTFVDDTVAGLVGAAECDALVGDVVNVACGREVSIRRIAELLGELVAAGGIAPVLAPPRPGDVRRHYADVGKAKRLFGFEPRVPIEEGLARTVAWFRERRIASRVDLEASGAPNW
jgi:UDP-glucose 4-epimerase